MSKSIRLSAPLPEFSVDARTPMLPGRRDFDRRIPTLNTRLVSSELADCIRIWVNEGGAGGEVG